MPNRLHLRAFAPQRAAQSSQFGFAPDNPPESRASAIDMLGSAAMRFGSIYDQLRLLHAPLLAGLMAVACAMTPDRLPSLDRRFYDVMETPEDQSAFLVAENQQAYLEGNGLWDQWSALPPEERKAAERGEVEVGFHEFALFMAWGPPADTLKRDRNGRNALIHTYIRCSSGPKRGKYVRNNLDCDGTSDETQVAIDNDLVIEIKYAT